MFDFDEGKSQSNLKKHGIDFVEVQRLWDDSNLLELPAKTVAEPRYLLVGKIEAKHWSAVVTYRNAGIRIISVHRSRAEEVKFYESQDI